MKWHAWLLDCCVEGANSVVLPSCIVARCCNWEVNVLIVTGLMTSSCKLFFLDEAILTFIYEVGNVWESFPPLRLVCECSLSSWSRYKTLHQFCPWINFNNENIRKGWREWCSVPINDVSYFLMTQLSLVTLFLCEIESQMMHFLSLLFRHFHPFVIHSHVTGIYWDSKLGDIPLASWTGGQLLGQESELSKSCEGKLVASV